MVSGKVRQTLIEGNRREAAPRDDSVLDMTERQIVQQGFFGEHLSQHLCDGSSRAGSHVHQHKLRESQAPQQEWEISQRSTRPNV